MAGPNKILDEKPVNHWRVYIILASNGSLYTGITTDIRRRWREHCSIKKGGAKFFQGRRPITLCYLEPGHDQRSASQREYGIKRLSRQQKWQLITRHYGPHPVT